MEPAQLASRPPRWLVLDGGRGGQTQGAPALGAKSSSNLPVAQEDRKRGWLSLLLPTVVHLWGHFPPERHAAASRDIPHPGRLCAGPGGWLASGSAMSGRMAGHTVMVLPLGARLCDQSSRCLCLGDERRNEICVFVSAVTVSPAAGQRQRKSYLKCHHFPVSLPGPGERFF